jgi:hypothetical protein
LRWKNPPQPNPLSGVCQVSSSTQLTEISDNPRAQLAQPTLLFVLQLRSFLSSFKRGMSLIPRKRAL